MIKSIGSSLSSLKAFGKKMAVSANNVANIESEGFKKSRAVIKEGRNNGVEVEITRDNSPGHPIIETIDGQTVEKELSNVDLAEEIPQTIQCQRGYEANLKHIETQDEMLGSLLDIIG